MSEIRRYVLYSILWMVGESIDQARKSMNISAEKACCCEWELLIPVICPVSVKTLAIKVVMCPPPRRHRS